MRAVATDPAATGLADRVRAAIAEGLLGGRMWLYSNYHCNLACRYCLTESSPRSERRALGAGAMRAPAAEGAALGFTAIGVTGGEPFLLPEMPALLAELSEALPVLVLTNGTLFEGHRLARLDPLLGADVALQLSLDSADPGANDALRGRGNHAAVVRAIERLVARGHRVRVATTCEGGDGEGLERLRALLGALGVAPEDHVVRTIVARGRAEDEGLGEPVTAAMLVPEATWSADGLFRTPFGPTVRGGALQEDLRASPQVLPAAAGVEALLAQLEGAAAGEAGRFR